MKRVLPLLIIFQAAMKATAFWLLRLLWVAGWLRRPPQANPEHFFDLLKA
jgi:hypothetical protein